MIQKIAAILRTENQFLVVTHVNPDGDAVGSLLGMSLALSEMGKSACSCVAQKLPPLYDFLQPDRILVTDPKDIPFKPDWILSVDAAEENRISTDVALFRPGAKLINIDHHRTNPCFGDLNLVLPSATSSAEIVHRLLKEADYVVSRDVGKCLFTGLITDTGCFRFAGVNSHTLRVAAELLDSGFDPSEVTIPLYEEHPLTRLHLERLMLERVEVHLDGCLIVSTLYDSDFTTLDAHRSETEDLVNRLREVRGVEVGILITEMPEGITRVSLRSKGTVDVAAVAKTFSGGGHRNAAGIKTTLSPGDIKEQLVLAIGKALSQKANPDRSKPLTYTDSRK